MTSPPLPPRVSPRFGITSLQAVEDRVRRLFGIGGDIGVRWTPDISLSLNVGDLAGPGTSDYRGRRFSITSTTAIPNVADRAMVWKFGNETFPNQGSGQAGVIIEYLRWEGLAAVVANTYLEWIATDSTSQVFPDINRAQIAWMENLAATQGPLVYEQAFAAVASFGNQPAFFKAGQRTVEHWPVGLFIQTGGYLALVNRVAAQTAGFLVTIQGRIF